MHLKSELTKKSVFGFIIMIFILCTIIHSKAYELEESKFFDGDWIIEFNNTTIAQNLTLGTNANLSVYGVLKLNSVIFTLNSTFGKILVGENATLEIINSSVISVYPSEIILKGDVKIDNSRIENLEIQIYSDNVTLSNNTITNSISNGIVIENSSPRVQNNTIKNNFKAGIYSISSKSVILENKIIFNSVGYVAQNSNDLLLSNNISNNRGYGAVTNNSSCKLENNTIFDNADSGIFLNKSSGLIKNNILNNNRWGIELLDSRAEFENNLFAFNREGSLVQKWSLKIEVINGNNEYVKDVSIAISNQLGTRFLGDIIDGYANYTLPEYEIINENKTQYSPYSIYCGKNSAFNTSLAVLNQSLRLKLKLLADVIIKSISTTELLPDRNVTIRIDFYNPYKIKISARVNVSIDSIPLYDSILLFTENTGIALNLTWYSREGSHKLEVWIDQQELVEELNETNNYEFRTIEIPKIKYVQERGFEYSRYALLILIFSLLGIAIFLILRGRAS